MGGPAPFPPLGTRFRGHDDAPTVIPAPEQESILGARGRPRPIPPDVPPSFLRKQESIPSAGTTTPQPSFLPPSRNPYLGRVGGPTPFPPLGTRFRGHDDAPTVIPALEQESIPGTRGERWEAVKQVLPNCTHSATIESVVSAIEQGGLLDVLDHPNQGSYPGQQIYVVAGQEYIHLAPFVIQADGARFLKTIIPSRKATREYWRMPPL